MIETPAQILSHAADPEAAESFVAWRKKIKKPLTDRAAVRILATLAEIKSAGGDPSEALDLAQEHGWMTIKPAWYWKQCPPAAQVQAKAVAQLDTLAERIKSGKPYLCRDISATTARAMVQMGLVSEQECRAVGVPL